MSTIALPVGPLDSYRWGDPRNTALRRGDDDVLDAGKAFRNSDANLDDLLGPESPPVPAVQEFFLDGIVDARLLNPAEDTQGKNDIIYQTMFTGFDEMEWRTRDSFTWRNKNGVIVYNSVWRAGLEQQLANKLKMVHELQLKLSLAEEKLKRLREAPHELDQAYAEQMRLEYMQTYGFRKVLQLEEVIKGLNGQLAAAGLPLRS